MTITTIQEAVKKSLARQLTPDDPFQDVIREKSPIVALQVLAALKNFAEDRHVYGMRLISYLYMVAPDALDTSPHDSPEIERIIRLHASHLMWEGRAMFSDISLPLDILLGLFRAMQRDENANLALQFWREMTKIGKWNTPGSKPIIIPEKTHTDLIRLNMLWMGESAKAIDTLRINLLNNASPNAKFERLPVQNDLEIDEKNASAGVITTRFAAMMRFRSNPIFEGDDNIPFRSETELERSKDGLTIDFKPLSVPDDENIDVKSDKLLIWTSFSPAIAIGLHDLIVSANISDITIKNSHNMPNAAGYLCAAIALNDGGDVTWRENDGDITITRAPRSIVRPQIYIGIDRAALSTDNQKLIGRKHSIALSAEQTAALRRYELWGRMHDSESAPDGVYLA